MRCLGCCSRGVDAGDGRLDSSLALKAVVHSTSRASGMRALAAGWPSASWDEVAHQGGPLRTTWAAHAVAGRATCVLRSCGGGSDAEP